MWEMKRAMKVNLRTGDELQRPSNKPLYMFSYRMFRTNRMVPRQSSHTTNKRAGCQEFGERGERPCLAISVELSDGSWLGCGHRSQSKPNPVGLVQHPGVKCQHTCAGLCSEGCLVIKFDFCA